MNGRVDSQAAQEAIIRQRLEAAARQRAAEQAREAMRAQQAAQAAENSGGTTSVNAAEHRAEQARTAPIAEDTFVGSDIEGTTEAQRQEAYETYDTDGEEGLSDAEFDAAYADLTTEEYDVQSRGASGEEVGVTQQQLEDQGFSPGEVDGQYGPNTEQATRQYQEARGLPADGQAGPQTRSALQIDNTVIAGPPTPEEMEAQGVTDPAEQRAAIEESRQADAAAIAANEAALQDIPEEARPHFEQKIQEQREAYEAAYPPEVTGGGGAAEGANAAIDEAEQLVGQPKHSAAYANADRDQRAGESEAIANAQGHVNGLPEGSPEREAAQARLDEVEAAHNDKWGIASPEEVAQENSQAFEENLKTADELNETAGNDNDNHDATRTYFEEQQARIDAVAETDPERAAEMQAQLEGTLTNLEDNDVSHADRVIAESMMEAGINPDALSNETKRNLIKTMVTKEEGDRPKGEWVSQLAQSMIDGGEEGQAMLNQLATDLGNHEDINGADGSGRRDFADRLVDWLPAEVLGTLDGAALNALEEGSRPSEERTGKIDAARPEVPRNV